MSFEPAQCVQDFTWVQFNFYFVVIFVELVKLGVDASPATGQSSTCQVLGLGLELIYSSEPQRAAVVSLSVGGY